MRFWTAVIMSGIAFTIGLLCGLMIQLPAETLPTLDVEGHHLYRVRRATQLNSTDVSSTDVNYIDHKQNANMESMNGDYTGLNTDKPDNQGYGAVKLERPINHDDGEYPNSKQDNVVYVNPIQQKLVLDNLNSVNGSNSPGKTNRGPGGEVNASGVESAEIPGQPIVAPGHTAANTIQNNHSKHFPIGDNDLIITTSVYWSDNIEHMCSGGFTEADVAKWRLTTSNEKFLAMNEGCGRMQNRVLTFQASGKACARYRINIDQIQGDIYSYYLGKLLGIHNIPPSVLHLADVTKDQWRMVAEDVANANWSAEKPIVLSQWINNLSPAYIPIELRNLSRTLTPHELSRKTRKQNNKLDNTDPSTAAASVTNLCELFQWSDLIVFDYLIANLDRVVNNLFNLQWNDKMMDKPAHNLEKTQDGRLIFLDNESGLFHGYRLLDRYAPYHESLLNSMCVFRKSTIDAIKRLLQSDSINNSIQTLFEKSEPLFRNIPRIPAKNIKILTSRMHAVLRQVQRCESQV